MGKWDDWKMGMRMSVRKRAMGVESVEREKSGGMHGYHPIMRGGYGWIEKGGWL